LGCGAFDNLEGQASRGGERECIMGVYIYITKKSVSIIAALHMIYLDLLCRIDSPGRRSNSQNLAIMFL